MEALVFQMDARLEGTTEMRKATEVCLESMEPTSVEVDTGMDRGLNCWECFDWLSDYQLLKKELVMELLDVSG
jgi:hypothetical protein